jgi:hypothetical protein
MQMNLHPIVRWVHWGRRGDQFFVRCTVCNQADWFGSELGINGFAHAHRAHESSSITHYGAGDLVARAASAVGLESCEPCEKRRSQMNRLFPRVWRR